MAKAIRLFAIRRRCDHCRQRVDVRVLYGAEMWCAWCAIVDARQLGAIEALEQITGRAPDERDVVVEYRGGSNGTS